mmetsp:Transcript_1988/g.7871  ORF Transcript_1988/g.7871 Transcript_1988/m.7871 type:complete len:216 (-) Transcript_1988:4225-4872(-)
MEGFVASSGVCGVGKAAGVVVCGRREAVKWRRSRGCVRMTSSSSNGPSQEAVEEAGGVKEDGSNDKAEEAVGLLGKLKQALLQMGRWMGFVGTEENKSIVEKLRTYGVAAVIAYGMFDSISYSLSFLIAMKSYTGSTGEALSWNTLPAILAIMYGINNFSRPFRIAGAALVAPTVDKVIVKPFSKFMSKLKQSLFGGGHASDESEQNGTVSEDSK